MSDHCGCHAHRTTAPPPATAGRTVAEIGRRSPRALAVLQAHGIDHCCGGHLTLAEAAAAAGADLPALERALEEAG